MVAAWWDRDSGSRGRLIQGMEGSPPASVSVSLCDDQNNGRGAAPISRQADTEVRERVSVVAESLVIVEKGRAF